MFAKQVIISSIIHEVSMQTQPLEGEDKVTKQMGIDVVESLLRLEKEEKC